MTRTASPRVVILAGILLASGPALAGCLGDEAAPEASSPTPAPPTGATPGPTGSGAPTEAPPAGHEIAFTSPLPATAAPFASIELRWTLSGPPASTPHTAVHADTVSHPAAAGLSPASYPQSYYPGPGPYAVPGEFVAALTLPASGALFVRPHAIVSGKQVWGEEVAIRVEGPAATGVSLVKYPAAAKAGVPFTIEWRVESAGAASSPHTAVHYGSTPVSKPAAELKPSDYPRATPFQNGSLPATFRATLTPLEPGILYLRGHAVVEGKSLWTEEVALAVGPPDAANVVLASLPASFASGTPFEVKWRVNLPANATAKTTPHTAVHFGPTSEADTPASGLTPETYPRATPFLNGTIPATFAAMVTVPDGQDTVYLRAHVVVDGVHSWSEESRVPISRS